YADPEQLAATLSGILGIAYTPSPAVLGGVITPSARRCLAPPPPTPVTAVSAAPGYVPQQPPFSGLYGPGSTGTPTPTDVVSAEILARGITIRAHRPTHSIFIRHYDRDLERIKKLIREQFDVPLPQVKIEARLVEVNRTDLFDIGVQWG